MVKRGVRLCAEIVITLGALACILQWLGIKPPEVPRMTLPHGVWLVLGLSLFGISIYSSARAWIATRATKPPDDQSKLLATYPSHAEPESLQDRITHLAHDLAAFVRGIEPAPEVEITPGMSTLDILSASHGNRRPEQIHNGYMHRFKDRAISMLHEINEKGVSTDIRLFEVEPPEIQRESVVRDLVRKLYITACNITIDHELRDDKETHVARIELLATSPSFLVKMPSSPKNSITLTNVGREAATKIELGPWKHEAIEIALKVANSPFGSIAVGGSEERIILASRVVRTGELIEVSCPLWEAMRSFQERDASDLVCVRFSNVNGVRFSQSFTLTSEIDMSITWAPDPVTLNLD